LEEYRNVRDEYQERRDVAKKARDTRDLAVRPFLFGYCGNNLSLTTTVLRSENRVLLSAQLMRSRH